MSNGIREMKKFIKSPQMKRNINDSAYLGDWLWLFYISRNRMFGNMIGRLHQSAMMEMSMVAEGYYAAKKRYKLNQAYGAKRNY
jgi:glycerol-3-phosphate dehydrogenase (NAD(P)+)